MEHFIKVISACCRWTSRKLTWKEVKKYSNKRQSESRENVQILSEYGFLQRIVPRCFLVTERLTPGQSINRFPENLSWSPEPKIKKLENMKRFRN